MRDKIIKYGAEWCQPCKVQSKIFDNLKNQYMDVEFIEIDIDTLNQDTLMDLNITSIPTLIFKVNGEIKFKHVGVLNEKDLINKINTIFN
jgi:thioredoxin 1